MYVRQAANALEILEYFARRLRPATPAEIADDLGWPRSSTFNLVGTLATKGYLYERAGRSGYYPSPRWLSLAEVVAGADPLPPELQRLVHVVARESGETTLIATAAGTDAIFLCVEQSRQPVRYFAQAGDRVPLHASSAGRALMAQATPAERQKLYRRIEFEVYSATTPTTPAAVEAAIAEAAERGFHQSHAEYTPDLAGVALPIPGQPRRLSILVVGPVSRCLDRRPETAALLRRHLAALPREGGDAGAVQGVEA
ncbi:transcriptional regulator, IclR family [Roseomonas rosea]|uniref:Transcriptional regulator, IclR family n=1 Tax=Muricoccus roseus TaxID=198092 RepID=A0A1M6IFZ0_9PROT|nr:IclR family transcriptional regulator [Roseomonas rosea]SHJ33394.1 transcriptional regulator, IclR family [Roseomonas rosea]